MERVQDPKLLLNIKTVIAMRIVLQMLGMSIQVVLYQQVMSK